MRSTSMRGVLGWLAAGLMFLLGPMCAWGYPRGDSLPGVSHLGRAYDLAVGRTATFAYDASGNLTNDGRRGFTYDAHDRLESVQVAGAWRTQFVHDGLNRLRVRTELTWSGGVWVTNAVVRYVYAGGLVVEERNGSNNATTVAYTRGADLSGTLQGAGGIGGLLALTRYDTPSPSHAWYHADGSGNVTALVNANQYVVARYLYDPFGGLVAQSGPWSEANRLRFSSKEWHAASGTYGFGRRFYDTGLQRWLNPDPIGIAGGINLYGFVGNNPVGKVDPSGMDPLLIFDRGAWGQMLDDYGIAPWFKKWVGDPLHRTFIGDPYANSAICQDSYLRYRADEGIPVEHGSEAMLAVGLAPLEAAVPAVGRIIGVASEMAEGIGVANAAAKTGVFSETGGAAMESGLFSRIQSAFQRGGGVMKADAESARLLRTLNPTAEGATLDASTIVLRQNPSTSAVYEELIHTAQMRRGMTDVTRMEIEAAEKLIRFRRGYGIPNAETRQTIERLRQLRGDR